MLVRVQKQVNELNLENGRDLKFEVGRKQISTYHLTKLAELRKVQSIDTLQQRKARGLDRQVGAHLATDA